MARRRKRTDDRPEAIDLGPVSITTMDRRDGERWYWRARRKDNRQIIWRGYATPAEAAAAVGRVLENGLPETSPSAPEAARTVADLLALWKDDQDKRHKGKQIADRTLRNYKHACRWWEDAFGPVRLDALTRAMVEDQLTTWQAEGVAARTCGLALEVLAAVVRWGRKRGVPGPDLARLSVDAHDDEHVYNAHTPSRDQVAAMLARMEPGRWRDLTELCALTGARIGEIVALRVGSYDRAAAVLGITGRDDSRKRRGKAKLRQWPVMEDLRRTLDRLTAGRDPEASLVEDLPKFPAPEVRRKMQTACELADVPVCSPHGLRRMVAMELLDAGVDPRTVSSLTGHSVMVLLRRYVRPTPPRLRDAVAKAGLGTIRKRGEVREFRKRKGEGQP